MTPALDEHELSEAREHRMLATSTAALLHAVAPLKYLSWSIAAVCFYGMTAHPLPSLAFALLASGFVLTVPTSWLAMRVEFDARLFDGLFGELAATDDATALHLLDRALLSLGVIQVTSERSLADRAQGARKLVQRMLISLALQVALALIAAGISQWRFAAMALQF